MNSFCTLRTIGFAILLAVSAALPANAAAGDLDTTFAGFGTDGMVFVPALSAKSVTVGDTASTGGMALAPDGKIVVAGART